MMRRIMPEQAAVEAKKVEGTSRVVLLVLHECHESCKVMFADCVQHRKV